MANKATAYANISTIYQLKGKMDEVQKGEHEKGVGTAWNRRMKGWVGKKQEKGDVKEGQD